MSLAIATKGESGGVYVGVDSIVVVSNDGVDPSTVSRVDPALNPKLIVSPPYIMAGVGSPRILNVLSTISLPELPRKAIRDIQTASNHVVKEVIPTIKEGYSQSGIMPMNTEEAGMYNAQLILAFGDYLFEVGPDFSVISYSDKYLCIGGASVIAHGAIGVASETLEDPTSQLCAAFKISERHSAACSSPFVLTNTIDYKITAY